MVLLRLHSEEPFSVPEGTSMFLCGRRHIWVMMLFQWRIKELVLNSVVTIHPMVHELEPQLWDVRERSIVF